MDYKKTIVIFISLFFISTAFNANAQEKICSCSESIRLNIYSCNYLEEVQEFTNHSFLLKVNCSCMPFSSEFNISERFNFTCFSIDLGSPVERYITIEFDVYELVNNTYLQCDLDGRKGIGSAEIIFDRYKGLWLGDDRLGDISGYGHLNGCDDKSYYEFERDYEICFSIDILDHDGDNIPEWFETNIYSTDPMTDDSDRDDDGDHIPLYWEWKWGYDPFVYDGHEEIDPEKDGLNNYEEYLVSSWGSDPYCQDIFVELDQMEPGPDQTAFYVPENSKIMVYQTYAKRNMKFHIDDGCMGGGEILPFDSRVWFGEEKQYYRDYFLHNDPDNWRHGVFRYALYVNDHFPIRGMEFPGENSILKFFKPGLNSYVISTMTFRNAGDFKHACIMLHELGHTMGMCMGRPLGCDNQLMRIPFSLQNILFKNYLSVMNYKYTYSILDYSDGSHGLGDYDDWGKMDLAYFQPDAAR